MRYPVSFPSHLLALLLTGALAIPLPLSAQELGRLFMSREQRANLDDIRYQSKFAPLPEPAPTPVVRTAEPVPADPVVSSLRINGIVRPSRGGGTVWLNNQQVERGSVTREGIQVTAGRRSRDGVRIQLPSGVDTIVLKPGQQIDVATGSVLEAYETGPDSNAQSAFASGAGEVAPKPTEATSPAVPSADTNTAVDDGLSKLSRRQMLEMLRESAGKLSESPGKAVAP